jgi:hypothetical protein
MATKRKAGSKTSSKEGSSPKMEALILNDPPIVVSGGGGGGYKPRKNVPANNIVHVGFNPKGLGHGIFSAQTNGAPTITGVQITFPGTGVRPVSISNLSLYTIEITFLTGLESPKRGAAASRKGKTSGKRPAPSKRK